MKHPLLTQHGTGFKNRTVVFGATLMLAAMLAITAIAGFISAKGDTSNAAVVINDFGCIIRDGNGYLAWVSKGHTVITRSENGRQ